MLELDQPPAIFAGAWTLYQAGESPQPPFPASHPSFPADTCPLPALTTNP